MTRESVTAKAVRYLSEARILVAYVNGDHVNAYARGDGETYRLGHNPASGWYCDCAARGDCCHLRALRLVTVRRGVR